MKIADFYIITPGPDETSEYDFVCVLSPLVSLFPLSNSSYIINLQVDNLRQPRYRQTLTLISRIHRLFWMQVISKTELFLLVRPPYRRLNFFLCHDNRFPFLFIYK